MKKSINVLGIFCIMFMISSCDHTQLRGEITIVTSTIQSEQPAAFILDVPEELEDIYSVMWAAEEMDLNTRYDMIYGESLYELYTVEELDRLFEGRKIETDRMAVFIPPNPGSYLIDVAGFYKQTNPQAITQIQIEIKQ